MARPDVSAFTERYYSSLPAFYRDTDEGLDWPLLRYLSLLGDQDGEVEDLVDRFAYTAPEDGGAPGDTSDLVDPLTADAAWLPWLAQLVGVDLLPELTEAERRNAILIAGAGWRAGTKTAIAEAAALELTGTRYVEVIDHYNGDAFTIGVRTRADETADPDAVITSIETFHARPAGFLIVSAFYAASWAVIESHYPTWTAIEAAGSWGAIESTQP